MFKDEYHVIGVMSGTSLDGIDLVDIRFIKEKTWSYNILHCETIPYPNKWKSILSNLIDISRKDLEEIDRQYTEFLSTTISSFITSNSIENIDFVSSHGHTALHQPSNGISYQIGNLPMLSNKLGLTVVCDFRIADVLLGGQGAPLVPVGDELLFSDFDYCLNLGGFANISTKIKGARIAYDIGPANIVLNHYVAKINLPYDEGGKLSSTGIIHQELLSELNSLAFYKQSFPKSLGLEWVQEQIFPIINAYNLSIQDTLRTFSEHLAIQIDKAISNTINQRVLCTGGGAYNTFLIDLLKAKSTAEIILPSNNVIEYKEALIFGLLGVLRVRNEINCFKSVTGAVRDHSSGKIFQPEIFA